MKRKEELSQYFPGGTEKRHENLNPDGRSPYRYIKLESSEYETRSLGI
jgi:hypothetical protein